MSPFSVGDIIALSTLLFQIYQKCREASREFNNLANLLKSVHLSLQSVRCAVEPIFEALPATHKASLADAIFGLRKITTDISVDLDSHKSKLSRIKFNLLHNPRDAELRLTTRLSNLSTCMSAIIMYVQVAFK